MKPLSLLTALLLVCNAAGWLEAAKLYMAIVGHSDAIPIARKSHSESPCTKDTCTVTFSDSPIKTGEPYIRYTLTFAPPTSTQPATLTGVVRRTIQP